MMVVSRKGEIKIIMKLQSMKGTVATLATAATLFISGVVANADTYTVKAGDTLSEIAEDKSTTVEKLVELNHIQNPDLIFVDQVLELGDVKANQASKAATKPSAAPTAQSNSVVPATPAPATDVATPNYSNYSSGVVLENGNTPGEIGSYAAARMAELTGVSATTRETIIARESNGQVDAYNPSGASGLFQTMPFWGSTATVEDQIQTAYRAYTEQGLAAWGF